MYKNICPLDSVRIIIYNDGVSPGNQLRHDQTRKIEVIYWSFKHGPGLGIDQLWWTLGVARTSIVSSMKGGTSAYIKAAMGLFLKPFNALRGFHLHVGDSTVLKFARFSIYIADEVALKDAFQFKGAAGLQLCPLCTNIVQEYSRLHEFESGLRPSTCTDPTKWKESTDATIFAKIRKLTASFGTVTKAQFEELEKTLGWVHNPHGLLGDGTTNEFELKPAQMIFYDYMHTFFVNGVFNAECGGLLSSLKSVGIGQDQLHDYLNNLTWPAGMSSKATTGQNVFRKKQEGNLKCSASECLGIYNPIRHFLISKMDMLGHCKSQVVSYLFLCECIDVLLAVRNNALGPNDLATAVSRYVKAHQTAHGTSLWVPKFHYLQHLDKMIANHKVVLGCFVHERKHRIAKKYAENIRRVDDGFETSILKDVVVINIRDLDDKEFDQLHIGLVEPVVANEKVSQLLRAIFGIGQVLQSRRAHFAMGSLCCVNDFVILNHPEGQRPVGQVAFFVSVGSLDLACVTMWEAQGQNLFQKTTKDCFVDLECIQECLTYKRVSPIQISVLPNSLWTV